ncbi:carbohydrate transporter [Dorcoceras hygrometricum]|uniref:Carbohydrate transporter n=1 Tax=Dorcoceras hygrometricum TaxID=472368 RepID=A0A2Z7BRN8_9LAMI|nr:carbohydrate transporter [Dorcoceras hygrometricum]
MASSFYSNSQHIDFDSVLAMDDQGMVSMFQAFMASGLAGSLGCPAVIYEAALVDLFENASVREGVIISTVAGQLVEISEEWLAESFDLPVDVGAEEAAGAPKTKAASKKRQAVAAVGAPVIKKKRTMRKKSSSSKDNLEIVAVAQEAVPIQMVEPITVDQPAGKTDGEEAVAAEVDASTDRDQTAVEVGEAAADKDFSLDDKQSDRAETWFDRAFDEILRNDSPVVTPSDTDEEEETVDVGTAGRDQQVQFSEEEPVVMEMNAELIDVDEMMSLEDILMTIPADVLLPSAGIEITKITMGKEIKIPEVNERTWFLNSLPKIPAENKGKAILVEKDPVNGNPAKEHYFFICADIDLLVNLRAQVIEAVDQFFHSFSFKKLATINIEELSRKEEQVLIWGETEITHVALSRKRYILLKYREVLVRKFLESWKNNFVPGKGSSEVDLKLIDMLSDIHLLVLEELREQALAHGLKWTRTCCSKIVEGSPRDRGAIIARTNTNTPSTCWLRTMIRVDGVWVVEPFCDQWVKIPRPVVCMKYLNSALLWTSSQLSLSVVEPVFRVAPRQSPVFAMRVSQFCSVFIDYSLFSWLPTVDITDFISPIALERTALLRVQRSYALSVIDSVQMASSPILVSPNLVSVAPHVQLCVQMASSPILVSPNLVSVAPHVQLLDAQYASSFSSDESMNFDDAPASISLPAAPSPDITEALNQDSNDQRNLVSLELQSSHKQLGTQIITTGLNVVDVRRVVRESHQELNARINSLDEQVAATRNDLLEFSAQAQQTLNIITSQLSELVAYINRGGDNKRGKVAAAAALYLLLFIKVKELVML